MMLANCQPALTHTAPLLSVSINPYKSIFYRQYIRTPFEVENEILDKGCYGVFGSTCRDDQNELSNKHLNKLEILLYKKKTQKSFLFIKIKI